MVEILNRLLRSISNPNKWVQQTKYIFIIFNVILSLVGLSLLIPGVVFASDSTNHNNVTYNHLIAFGVIVTICGLFGLVSAFIAKSSIVVKYMLLLGGLSFLEGCYVIVIIGFLLDRWVRSVMRGEYRLWVAHTGWKYIFVIIGIAWIKLICSLIAWSFCKNLKIEETSNIDIDRNVRTRPKNSNAQPPPLQPENAQVVPRTDYNLFFQLWNKFLRRQPPLSERRESSC